MSAWWRRFWPFPEPGPHPTPDKEDDMATDPPDVPGEADPPDLRLALIAAIVLLDDVRDRLTQGGDTNTDTDLTLRTLAVAAVLRRLRDREEE